MGTLPALPLAPRLVRAGVSWVTLEWGRPEGSPSEDQLKYTLEIQEDNNVSTTHVNTHITLYGYEGSENETLMWFCKMFFFLASYSSLNPTEGKK